MSFTFKWPRFSDQFHADAIEMLEAALNKGNKPPVIADRIEVVELEMGTQPPELEIRDIGDLTMNQFRGIFRLTYGGDAHIVLKTKVQANPLYHKKPDIHLMGGSRGMLAANQPLVVPMLLRLSNFKLNSYVVLVVSKQKGITLVFKTDPLQNVDISSTFDSITVIQKFIQKEIEGQLRQMFREDLPGIIHRLSQQWVKATTVEAPYLTKRSHVSGGENTSSLDLSRSFRPPMFMPQIPIHHTLRNQQSLRQAASPRTQLASPRSVTGGSSAARAELPPFASQAPGDTPSSFEDGDNPGSRTEGIQEKGGYSGLGRHFKTSKGLADLTEEASDLDDIDEVGSFDMVEWEDTIPDNTPRRSFMEGNNVTEYETLPAVGGGSITRPRVYHSPSLLYVASGISTQSLSDASSRMTLPAFQRHSQSFGDVRRPLLSQLRAHSALSLPRINSGPQLSMHNPYFPDLARSYHNPSSSVQHSERLQDGRSEHETTMKQNTMPYGSPQLRSGTPDTSKSPTSRSSSGSGTLPTPPSFTSLHADASAEPFYDKPARRLSISSGPMDEIRQSSPANHYLNIEPDMEIVLRPGLNNAISQLSLLNYSNHTLSPYTRALEHFTVRSVPPKPTGPSGLSHFTERQPVRAKRKRTYRIGGKSSIQEVRNRPNPPISPTLPSEFDASDIDRYFRTGDDHLPRFPDMYSSHLRHRTSYRTV